MLLDDLEIDFNSLDLVKSHKCSGKMEHKYSDLLGESFAEYENFVCQSLDVDSLDYVKVMVSKFKTLTLGDSKIQDLISNSLCEKTIIGDKIEFTSYVCNLNDKVCLVVSWKPNIFPRCFIYQV